MFALYRRVGKNAATKPPLQVAFRYILQFELKWGLGFFVEISKKITFPINFIL